MKLDIDWTAFLAVTGVVLATAIVLPTLFAGGVRLLELDGRTSTVARVGAYACFALCAAAVLFGLWVVIPQFH